MTLRPPPHSRQGLVKRGQLEQALKERERVFIDGQQQVPPSSTTPTGTGFRHVTAGTEDPAAKLVDTADINPHQVTYDKIQETAAEAVLIGRGEGAGPGEFEEIELGDNLEMVGKVLNVTVQQTSTSFLWQSEKPAQTGTHERFYPNRNGSITWIQLFVVKGDGVTTAEIDILKNGVSIFVTRPTVNAGSFFGSQIVPNTTAFDDDDFWTVNVISTGLTAGALRAEIRYVEDV